MKHNTSPVPHLGAVIVPDITEAAFMPPIEEKNCIKSASNAISTEFTSTSTPSIHEPTFENRLTINSNDGLTSSTTPNFVEAEAQTSIENKNVSKRCNKFIIRF